MKPDLYLAHLERPYAFTVPWERDQFALLVVVIADDVTALEQAALSACFVAQGCRFAVCSGHDCASWDESIDSAYRTTAADHDPSGARRVMTSWHESDEPLEEIVDYFLRQTSFDAFVPTHFAVAIVGGSEAEAEIVTRTVVARMLEEPVAPTPPSV